jgi:hypothetical protein
MKKDSCFSKLFEIKHFVITKRMLIALALAPLLIGQSAFADGEMVFVGRVRGVWDNFSRPQPFLGPTEAVTFLWGDGTPLVNSIATAIPTNAAPNLAFDHAAAWNYILNDPNYHLAVDANTGNIAIGYSDNFGKWKYPDTQVPSELIVSAVTPGAHQVYVIAWDKRYDTPSAAAAAGSPLGWSGSYTVFFENPQFGVPGNVIGPDFAAFGVVPEPQTVSLIALGAAALLGCRRNTKKFPPDV